MIVMSRLAYVVLLLCLSVAGAFAAQPTDDLTVDQYLQLRKSLNAGDISLATAKTNPPAFVGKTIEVVGRVNGVARGSDSFTFVLAVGNECLVVKAQKAPSCIQNGSTIRALVTLGGLCIAGLSDLSLAGAAYDYDVRMREEQLAAKPSPPQKTVQPPPRSESAQLYAATRQARGISLSSRAAQVYEPYRKAIARFNPKLSQTQLDTITASVLAFSDHYGIDPRLVVALILVESGFKPNATSPKGAMGLGQLMPGTAKGLGVGNPYDPVQNVEASVRLITGHLSKYGGDLALALSAYNAGAGAVKKYGGVPPYRETQNYVNKVCSLYRALCGAD